MGYLYCQVSNQCVNSWKSMCGLQCLQWSHVQSFLQAFSKEDAANGWIHQETETIQFQKFQRQKSQTKIHWSNFYIKYPFHVILQAVHGCSHPKKPPCYSYPSFHRDHLSSPMPHLRCHTCRRISDIETHFHLGSMEWLDDLQETPESWQFLGFMRTTFVILENLD